MSKKCAICFQFTASVLVAWFPLPMKDSSLQWNDLNPRLTPLAGWRWCYSPLQNLWGCQKRVLRSVSSYGLPFLSRTISLQLMSISSTSSLLRRPQLYSNSLLPVFFPVFANHHPTLRGVFPCARFWRSQERLFSNLVRSLLSMRCMLLGYNFEPRPRSCALGTARSVMTIC